ncbi:hypothetical protein OC683_02430 ['Crotalaria aegyptiaca' phytoplasma]|uniref:Uncharacterized protein n=1 Tax=Candidatus Phytoplasma crotalariae TaxID=2982627 RepID=A0ABT9D4F3_9MOLU|nr:hypothetical protein ['Crotalaria aegyptiaca' phytoplasma]MDO8059445.1 hypothetical protein ['Crotalaria aegyptiaca' phytoplasma]
MYEIFICILEIVMLGSFLMSFLIMISLVFESLNQVEKLTNELRSRDKEIKKLKNEIKKRKP